MKFKIIKDYYDDIKLYEKSSIDIQPGITVLVGCNGSGKSTLIRQIKNSCDILKIPCLEFDQTSMESPSILMEKMILKGKMDEVARLFASSEGMRIKESVYQFGIQYLKFTEKIKKNQKHLFFFFDAVDSGLSIDNVLEIKSEVFESIIKNCNEYNKEAYIIVSANEYEMCRNENCLVLPDLKYKEIKTYDSYRKIIIRSRKKRNLLYGGDEFIYE